MTLDLQAGLSIAEDIARRAGALLRDGYDKPREVSFKGDVDLVTQVDRQSERLIVDALGDSFPDHSILAEETGETAGNSGYQWIVDPLDGTTNYAHSFPMFAVSIGLKGPEALLLGVIYDPLRDECFTTMRGSGAKLNGETVRVTEEANIKRALLATGFPYDRQTAADNNTIALGRFVRKAQGVRRAGAASLDMAYVACGRVDAYWERGPHAWDVAAGTLLVRESGGMVTNYAGNEENLLTGSHFVASNGALHQEMLAVLAVDG